MNVCSWGEYIDEDLIYQFEDETGIKVNYQTAESNEALYSLLKTGAGDYDVIVPSDYMIARLHRGGHAGGAELTTTFPTTPSSTTSTRA